MRLPTSPSGDDDPSRIGLRPLTADEIKTERLREQWPYDGIISSNTLSQLEKYWPILLAVFALVLVFSRSYIANTTQGCQFAADGSLVGWRGWLLTIIFPALFAVLVLINFTNLVPYCAVPERISVQGGYLIIKTALGARRIEIASARVWRGRFQGPNDLAFVRSATGWALLEAPSLWGPYAPDALAPLFDGRRESRLIKGKKIGTIRLYLRGIVVFFVVTPPLLVICIGPLLFVCPDVFW